MQQRFESCCVTGQSYGSLRFFLRMFLDVALALLVLFYQYEGIQTSLLVQSMLMFPDSAYAATIIGVVMPPRDS